MHALIIDPHYSTKIEGFLFKNAVKHVTILLTHEHPDHTSGVNWLMKNFDTTVICHERCATLIANERNNRPILLSFIISQQDKENGTNLLAAVSKVFKNYKCLSDIVFDNYFKYTWNGYTLAFYHTPGHSEGSCCIVFENTLLFSGDSLLENTPIITSFKGGSIDDYRNKTLSFFYSLKKGIVVLPGHGSIFTLKKEILDNIEYR
jgi:glyoxylase-like metal-dependent hydrolase (beta-lactamase superfamily II)